jgi:hypothetical protein
MAIPLISWTITIACAKGLPPAIPSIVILFSIMALVAAVPAVGHPAPPCTPPYQALMAGKMPFPQVDMRKSAANPPGPQDKLTTANLALATAFTGSTGPSGFPPPDAWDKAGPIQFESDWQGKNPDPERRTEVRLLWTPTTLYLRFIARDRTITVFADADANGRRDKLWDRDVAEVFLQPDARDPRRYKEFEASPNGFWIDLNIVDGGLEDLKSGMQRRVTIDESRKVWVAELAIPMKSVVPQFDPNAEWRVNFYRVEGSSEPRFYSSWQATKTPQPDFHVPELFGYLKFAPAGSQP